VPAACAAAAEDAAGAGPGVVAGAAGVASATPATSASVPSKRAARTSAEKEQTTIMADSSNCVRQRTSDDFAVIATALMVRFPVCTGKAFPGAGNA
jgi:hypothetical protein